MAEWKKLEDLVNQLREETNKENSVAILQKISNALINDYIIKVCGVTIEPLWVEAYCYHATAFPDCNTHMNEKQKKRFGQLYFHKVGHGGVDLCLSNGEYYLSFLLKATWIYKGENRSQKVFQKQTETSSSLLKLSGRTKSEIEDEKNILFHQKNTHQIMYTKRIHLTKPCFKDDDLAAFPLDIISNPKCDFTFARKSLEKHVHVYLQNYILNHAACTKQECKNECRRIFGWVPDSAQDIIKNLI